MLISMSVRGAKEREALLKWAGNGQWRKDGSNQAVMVNTSQQGPGASAEGEQED